MTSAREILHAYGASKVGIESQSTPLEAVTVTAEVVGGLGASGEPDMYYEDLMTGLKSFVSEAKNGGKANFSADIPYDLLVLELELPDDEECGCDAAVESVVGSAEAPDPVADITGEIEAREQDYESDNDDGFFGGDLQDGEETFEYVQLSVSNDDADSDITSDVVGY